MNDIFAKKSVCFPDLLFYSSELLIFYIIEHNKEGF